MTTTPPRRILSLSPRLLPVLRLVSQGHTHAEVGRELHLSRRTITTYMCRAIEELGAQNAPHAVALAYEAGILP